MPRQKRQDNVHNDHSMFMDARMANVDPPFQKSVKSTSRLL